MHRGQDLSGRTLVVAPEYRAANPRREHSHGWLAFEVLRRATGQQLTAEEYERRLFNPPPDIAELAQRISGERNAYQDLKHIRCDISQGRVHVTPPLDPEWYSIERCAEKKPQIPSGSSS
jgi:hypothetical protein